MKAHNYLLIIYIFILVLLISCNFINPFSQNNNNNNNNNVVDVTPIGTTTSLPTITPTFTATLRPTATITATPTVSPADPPISTWTYKLPITVTENSNNTLTDYQVLVTLTAGTFTYGHLLSNGNDIRFLYNGTPCSYWIQSWNNPGTSVIWVKLPGNLPASQASTLYMYYGLVNAVPKSSGDETFLLYDDFNDDFFDTAKWTDGSLNSAYVTESSQNMQLFNNNDVAPKARGYLISHNQYEKNISVDCYMKVAGISKGYFDGFLHCDGVHSPDINYDYPQNGYIFEWRIPSYQVLRLNKVVGNATTWDIQVYNKEGDTNWHTVSMQYFNQQIKLYFDNTLTLDTIDTTDFTTRYIAFATRHEGTWSSGTQVSLDWVIVRKSAPQEPTAVLGVEGPNN